MSKKKLSFEEEMAKLEELVGRLESGELGLEESLSTFEEGTKIARALVKVLEKAEGRVAKLTESDEGEFVLEPFDPENEDD
ncbi:exodeoxyribonuclease VII small subunit [bacterium]|nr:exodeoxyribonuclease VII small subunit [bacterium]